MVEKVQFKHLEPVVARFNVIVTGLCVQLKQHGDIIISCKHQGNMRALNKEQLAASRAVKKVKKALKELDELEGEVVDEDVVMFQLAVKPLKVMAYGELVRLVELDDDIVSHIQTPHIQNPHSSTLITESPGREQYERDEASLQTMHSPHLVKEQQVQTQHDQHQQLTELAILEDTAQSWHQLQSDIQDVAEIMQQFGKVVHEQAETLDTIEANVEQATESTRLGLLELVQARRAKIAGGTLTAAALGAMVGGPVGMLAGFKVAGLVTAALGGYMGYRGAGYINNSLHSEVGLEAPTPSVYSEEGDEDEEL